MNLRCQADICLQFPEYMRRLYVVHDFFNNTIGVKQGCILSPTLFGLCIDELEEMVTKFVKEECVEEVAIGNVVIMLLLYLDDVVLLII